MRTTLIILLLLPLPALFAPGPAAPIFLFATMGFVPPWLRAAAHGPRALSASGWRQLARGWACAGAAPVLSLVASRAASMFPF